MTYFPSEFPVTDPASATWQALYLQDLEEALRKGILPSRQAFRSMLALGLRSKIQVDYTALIQESFPRLRHEFAIEGGDSLSSFLQYFWNQPQLVRGGKTGTVEVDMNLFDAGRAISSVPEVGAILSSGKVQATLGEALHFIQANVGFAPVPPLIATHRFSEGERMSVFIGSRSGGADKVIRFEPIDFRWRGCRFLTVTS